MLTPHTPDFLQSRLTTKYQATIPADARKILGLRQGDYVRFTIEKDSVRIEKAKPLDRGVTLMSQAAFSEWDSEEDNEAFNHL